MSSSKTVLQHFLSGSVKSQPKSRPKSFIHPHGKTLPVEGTRCFPVFLFKGNTMTTFNVTEIKATIESNLEKVREAEEHGDKILLNGVFNAMKALSEMIREDFITRGNSGSFEPEDMKRIELANQAARVGFRARRGLRA